MASQFRTAFVGLGVLAVCAAMASLKGHHLLLAFAGASLVCALRSWFVMRSKDTKNSSPEATVPRRTRTAEQRKPSGKIYHFPSTAAFQVSDAQGS